MFRGTLIRSGNNAKTVKGDGEYETAIMYLAPARLSMVAGEVRRGGNTCPMAEQAGCIAGCLNTAGRGRMSNVQQARINKTRRYFANRAAFMAELVDNLERFVRYCARKGVKPAVRLNGTSDIQWETAHPAVRNVALFGAAPGEVIPGNDPVTFASIFEAFPEVQFYDYTKVYNRAYKSLPPNYRLTLSFSEANRAYADAIRIAATETGCNVAVVFRDKALRDRYLHTGFEGVPVLDGDETDLRFLDRNDRVYVVGLYAKGAARRDQSGFVID